jgi:16S rRNA processing protein RimM
MSGPSLAAKAANGAAPAQGRLRVGVIVDAHGIRGQVKVRSFTSDPRSFTAYGLLRDRNDTRAFRMKIMGEAKNLLIVAVHGVTTRNDAEALRGTELYIDKTALPALAANEFYCSDLQDVAVHTPDGKPFGKVLAVHNFGAGDIVEIALPDGHAELFPLTRAIFPKIDLATRTAIINPPETMTAWGEEKQATPL